MKTPFCWHSANNRPFPNHTRPDSGYTADTQVTGGGSPHENRPPYFVLAYIIKPVSYTHLSHTHSGIQSGPAVSGPVITPVTKPFSTFNKTDYEDSKE